MCPMRALLIEDEPTVARAIELMFAEEGIKVDMTDLGEEGLDLGKLYDYDIICLDRSEEHTSELQSLMRISYAVFCLKKKKQINNSITRRTSIITTNQQTTT